MQPRRLVFTGSIAGLGTTAGVRLVQLKAIDPVACRMVRGVHTAGSAGNGRREYYPETRTTECAGRG